MIRKYSSIPEEESQEWTPCPSTTSVQSSPQTGFKSLRENLDTTTSGGKLIFHVFGALAEFERDIIKERTQAGLLAARTRGRVGGRPRSLTAKEIAIAKSLYADPDKSIKDICQALRISKMTLYRYVEPGKRGEAAGNKSEQ